MFEKKQNLGGEKSIFRILHFEFQKLFVNIILILIHVIMDNYNSDGNDPLKLHGLINSLRRQLREERFKRHELQTSNDRMTHRLRSLEHSLKKQTPLLESKRKRIT